MSETQIGSLIGWLAVLVGFSANFYLFSQWLIYPKLRRRFQVCRPYLALGWILYILGGSVLRPLGRVQGSEILSGLGTLIALIGLWLTVYASIRLLRANAAERQASRAASAASSMEGAWPPPPNKPVA